MPAKSKHVPGNGAPKPSQEVADFIETYCRVPEGIDVGKPIKLRDWQRADLELIYDSPTRRAIISEGRKNGKTAFAACLLLTHLSGPRAIPNSQIYSTAQSRDQASIVNNLAVKMVRLNADLSEWIRIKDTVKELIDVEEGTIYKALSADHSTAYGLSPIMAFHDELGQVRGPRSELYDAIESGMLAHAAPLSVIISTQAPGDADLLSTLIDDAIEGRDPRTKLILRAADAEDDPTDPATWAKANPALGDFLNQGTLRELAEKAIRLPSFMSGFQNLNLNMRVAAENHFLSPEIWKQNGAAVPSGSLEDALFVYGGLDLSSRNDLTALVLVAVQADGSRDVHPFFWAPKNGLADRAKKDRVPYDLWVQQGFLEATPGATIDYDFVAHRVKQIQARCNLVAIAYDRWRIDDFKRSLDEVNCSVELVPFGQGYKDMAPALEDFESDSLEYRFRHGNHPVLTFCAASAVTTSSPAGDRKLDKARSTGRIDGMVALAMANRVSRSAPAPFDVSTMIGVL